MDSLLSQLYQTSNVQSVSISRNNAMFKIRKDASWRRMPLSQDFTGYCIHFVFSCEYVVQEWLLGPDYVQFHQERPPNSKQFITIHHHVPEHPRRNKRTDLEDMRGICKAIAHVLTHEWTLPEPYRSKLIRRAAWDTMKIINSSPTRHDTFTLRADVMQVVFRLIRSDSLDVPHMVPATEESIKKLERKIISASDLKIIAKDCVICLEELPEGCEVVSMPCSHAFHANCIEEWLKTSHYCPLCRFKMPAIDDDDN